MNMVNDSNMGVEINDAEQNNYNNTNWYSVFDQSNFACFNRSYSPVELLGIIILQ